MVRVLLRSRSSDPQALKTRASTLGVAVIAALTGLVLVGCSGGLSREFTNGASPASSGAAVAPAEKRGATDGAVTSSSGGAPGGVSGSAPSDVPLPTAGQPRQVIRNGSAELEVRSVADAFEAVRQIAVAAGGVVADST